MTFPCVMKVMRISLHICTSLHFSAFLCISIHFSAFQCISLNFSAFLYISLNSSEFFCISPHLTFYILGQFYCYCYLLKTIPAGRVRYMGLMHMVTARSASIGTRTFAVAVLEAMFVIDTENISIFICL